MKHQIGWLALRVNRLWAFLEKCDSEIKFNLAETMKLQNQLSWHGDRRNLRMLKVFIQQKCYLITIETHCEPKSSFKLLPTLKCQNKHSGRAAVCAYFLWFPFRSGIFVPFQLEIQWKRKSQRNIKVLLNEISCKRLYISLRSLNWLSALIKALLALCARKIM